MDGYSHWFFWSHYFRANYDWMYKPEEFLYDIKKRLPSYITQIINVGCASGRDFIPFNGEYKLIGVDIAPYDQIKWVDKFENLTYYQCYIKDFSSLNVLQDLSTSFVYTQNSMMYETEEGQIDFYRTVLERGCKNMLFHEHHSFDFNREGFKLDPEDFQIEQFRPPANAYIKLDI